SYSPPFPPARVNSNGGNIGEEQNTRSGSENKIYGNYQNPNNQLYGELMQERAKNHYLLRQLGEYPNPSFNRPTEEESSDYYESRNNSQPDETYRIDDYNEYTRRSRGAGYVLPIVVPNNNRSDRISEQKVIPKNNNHVNIPRHLDISSGLPQLSAPGLRDLFPKIRRRNHLDLTDSLESTWRNINNISLEKKNIDLP